MDEQTQRIILDISDKLGANAENIWNALIRQAMVNGIIVLSIWLFLAIGLTISYKFIRNKTPMPVEGNETAAWVIWWIVCLLSIFVFLITFIYVESALFNPEFWAIRRLIITR